jgi:hypothetical protein
MKQSAKNQREAARLYAESLRDVITPIANLPTREIARILNREGFTTVRARPWSSMAVSRLLRRLSYDRRRATPDPGAD